MNIVIVSQSDAEYGPFLVLMESYSKICAENHVNMLCNLWVSNFSLYQ